MSANDHSLRLLLGMHSLRVGDVKALKAVRHSSDEEVEVDSKSADETGLPAMSVRAMIECAEISVRLSPTPEGRVLASSRPRHSVVSRTRLGARCRMSGMPPA